MKKQVNRSLVDYIVSNWDDNRNGEEVQEIIEAIVAEIKQDHREYQRRHGRNDEADAFFEGLICDVQSPEFWEKFQFMSSFEFDY